jgi:hypothetical protein
LTVEHPTGVILRGYISPQASEAFVIERHIERTSINKVMEICAPYMNVLLSEDDKKQDGADDITVERIYGKLFMPEAENRKQK